MVGHLIRYYCAALHHSGGAEIQLYLQPLLFTIKQPGCSKVTKRVRASRLLAAGCFIVVLLCILRLNEKAQFLSTITYLVINIFAP